MKQQQPTLVERVIALVSVFEGYSREWYCDALCITRDQFHSVAKRHLSVYGGRGGGHLAKYYLKNSARYPQS